MRKLCVWELPIWETLYSIKCKFQAKSTELINNINFLYEVRKYKENFYDEICVKLFLLLVKAILGEE